MSSKDLAFNQPEDEEFRQMFIERGFAVRMAALSTALAAITKCDQQSTIRQQQLEKILGQISSIGELLRQLDCELGTIE